jgi:hypothetical protein
LADAPAKDIINLSTKVGQAHPDCCDAGTSCEPCEGDVTGNGLVDGLDLAAVLGAWGTNGKGEFPTDLNHDGIVDAQDLALVLSGWGKCP